MTATGNATYAAGNDAHRLARDPELLRLCVLAIREGYAIIDALGLPVSPGWFRLWQRLPLPVITQTFGRFLDSKAWELGTEQLISMRDEVDLLTGELQQLATEAGVRFPPSSSSSGAGTPPRAPERGAGPPAHNGGVMPSQRGTT